MTLDVRVTLKEMECASCGIIFAAPDFWICARQDEHDEFWCPNGCCLYYPEATLSDIRDGKAVFEKPFAMIKGGKP